MSEETASAYQALHATYTWAYVKGQRIYTITCQRAEEVAGVLVPSTATIGTVERTGIRVWKAQSMYRIEPEYFGTFDIAKEYLASQALIRLESSLQYLIENR